MKKYILFLVLVIVTITGYSQGFQKGAWPLHGYLVKDGIKFAGSRSEISVLYPDIKQPVDERFCIMQNADIRHKDFGEVSLLYRDENRNWVFIKFAEPNTEIPVIQRARTPKKGHVVTYHVFLKKEYQGSISFRK